MTDVELRHEQWKQYKLQGHTNKEVAEYFNVHPDTVKAVCRGVEPQGRWRNYQKPEGVPKKTKEYYEERNNKICELRLSGASFEEISEQFNLKTKNVIKICQQNKVDIQLREKRNKEIVELRNQKYSMKQIAEMLCIKPGIVEVVCKKNGVAGKLSDRKADYSKLPQLHQKPSEDYAREVIERKLNGFSYFGNYTGSSGTADIQCNVCGDVFTQPFITIRQGKKVFCRNCRKIAKDKAREAANAIRLAERQKRQSEKDLELFLNTHQVECVVCGKIFITHKRNVKCCSPECSKKNGNIQSSIRKDKRITKDKRIDKGITAKRLYKRDGGVCWICGGMCDLNDYVVRDDTIICGDYYPSVDHVIAICDGGEDAWDNVKLAHRICNSLRYYKKVTPSIRLETA